MRFCLLPALLLAATGPAFAQATPAVVHYQYATLHTASIYGRNPRFEYGQHARHATPSAELEQLAQQLDNLDSGPLALTYLTNHGWEYVGMSASESTNNYSITYLVRRPVQ